MPYSQTGVAQHRRPDVATRRAAIVARYVAIPSPTLTDDADFAAELGLSVQSLYKLAKAWRLHREARALNGAYTEITEQDRIDALAATASPDLTGVAPARRAETLERLKALRYYLQLPEPTHDDLLNVAASVGLGEQGFRQTLRNWLLHRSPMALPSARRPLHVSQRKRPTIDARVEVLISQAMKDVGIHTTARKVHSRVKELSDIAGLKPPTSSTIYYRVMKARAKTGDTAPQHMSVDHAALLLAVNGPAGPQVPVLSVVFARPSGRILSYALSLSAPSPKMTSRLLAQAIVEVAELHPAETKLDIGFEGDEWTELAETLTQSGVRFFENQRRFKPGKALGESLGDIIGNVRTCPRFTRNPKNLPRKAVGADLPFTFEHAVAIVDDAIKLHNASRPNPTLSFIDSRNAMQLADRLMLIAG